MRRRTATIEWRHTSVLLRADGHRNGLNEARPVIARLVSHTAAAAEPAARRGARAVGLSAASVRPLGVARRLLRRGNDRPESVIPPAAARYLLTTGVSEDAGSGRRRVAALKWRSVRIVLYARFAKWRCRENASAKIAIFIHHKMVAAKTEKLRLQILRNNNTNSSIHGTCKHNYTGIRITSHYYSHYVHYSQMSYVINFQSL